MARIAAVPAEQAGVFGRLVYRLARWRFGMVLEPISVALHHRGVFVTGLVHEGVVERALRKLPSSLRDLVVYRVARTLGCSWCVDFGTMKMRLAGLDTTRLDEIDDYRTSGRFTELERLALAYADAMTASPMTVDDEQVAELVERLGRAGVLELTYAIAMENMRARNNGALGIVDQGFTASCSAAPTRRSGRADRADRSVPPGRAAG